MFQLNPYKLPIEAYLRMNGQEIKVIGSQIWLENPNNLKGIIKIGQSESVECDFSLERIRNKIFLVCLTDNKGFRTNNQDLMNRVFNLNEKCDAEGFRYENLDIKFLYEPSDSKGLLENYCKRYNLNILKD
ncbi:MAG: hypothetical protein KKG60_02105 [Nanoarchaeota archaeon]|nr:hypothetical protein [Nanoarchaeota archaeon]